MTGHEFELNGPDLARGPEVADPCLRKTSNKRYGAVVWKIWVVNLFIDRLNASKLTARMIERSRKTPTKKFDPAGSKLGSLIFENNRRDSIRTVSLPRIMAKDGMENFIMKNFKIIDEIVRGWRNKRNMPSIIQNRVVSKGLSEVFSFRQKRDSCGVVSLK